MVCITIVLKSKISNKIVVPKTTTMDVVPALFATTSGGQVPPAASPTTREGAADEHVFLS